MRKLSLSQGDGATQGTFVVVTTGWEGASVIWWGEARVLLHTLKCTGQAPPHRVVWPQMSPELRLRTRGSKKTEVCSSM